MTRFKDFHSQSVSILLHFTSPAKALQQCVDVHTIPLQRKSINRPDFLISAFISSPGSSLHGRLLGLIPTKTFYHISEPPLQAAVYVVLANANTQNHFNRT